MWETHISVTRRFRTTSVCKNSWRWKPAKFLFVVAWPNRTIVYAVQVAMPTAPANAETNETDHLSGSTTVTTRATRSVSSRPRLSVHCTVFKVVQIADDQTPTLQRKSGKSKRRWWSKLFMNFLDKRSQTDEKNGDLLQSRDRLQKDSPFCVKICQNITWLCPKKSQTVARHFAS